ncbi:MAG: heme utilization protein HutZ [Pseudomonadota bacterium]
MVDETILAAEIQQFIDSHKTLHMACLANIDASDNSAGKQIIEPNISYTPFIFDKEKQQFFIYISKLAEHGQYLPGNKSIAILLIEDEQRCKNLFARKRLTYNCSIKAITRDNPLWTEQIKIFQQQFGKIMDLLSQFSDFDLYSLTPERGTYVQGFGKAYRIHEGKISHLSPRSPAPDEQ